MIELAKCQIRFLLQIDFPRSREISSLSTTLLTKTDKKEDLTLDHAMTSVTETCQCGHYCLK